MNIYINCEKTIRSIDNFWNHIHFHPTDAIEDEWGKHIIRNVSKDKVAKLVRMYTMFEDIVLLTALKSHFIMHM